MTDIQAALRQAQTLSKDNSEAAQQIHAIGVLTALLKQSEEEKAELLKALEEIAAETFNPDVTSIARAAIERAKS